MRAVIQRCGYASVNVEGKMVAEIGKGILALVGFGPQDTEKDIDYIIDKTVNLRIFSDENDKMNLYLCLILHFTVTHAMAGDLDILMPLSLKEQRNCLSF